MASPPQDAKYPDTIAITYDENNHKLTSIYNDHSVYVWDVFHIKRVSINICCTKLNFLNYYQLVLIVFFYCGATFKVSALCFF